MEFSFWVQSQGPWGCHQACLRVQGKHPCDSTNTCVFQCVFLSLWILLYFAEMIYFAHTIGGLFIMLWVKYFCWYIEHKLMLFGILGVLSYSYLWSMKRQRNMFGNLFSLVWKTVTTYVERPTRLSQELGNSCSISCWLQNTDRPNKHSCCVIQTCPPCLIPKTNKSSNLPWIESTQLIAQRISLIRRLNKIYVPDVCLFGESFVSKENWDAHGICQSNVEDQEWIT